MPFPTLLASDKLFAVLRNMRDAGEAIVIITHKMHEVEELSDRVAILRHGHFIGDMPTAKTNAQEMTNMMVGHAVTLNIERPEPVDPKPRIEVKGLTVRSIDGILKLDDVSFTANSGEILGIAGISGCGQKELLEAIAGLQPVRTMPNTTATAATIWETRTPANIKLSVRIPSIKARPSPYQAI